MEMIGATADAIDKAEDLSRFDKAMRSIGLECPRRHRPQHGRGLEGPGRSGPLHHPPSFTMGGSGGGIAYNPEEFVWRSASAVWICRRPRAAHRRVAHRLERVRDGGGADRNDNCIIVCAIENFDPMGITPVTHHGRAGPDADRQRKYQIMRNASMAVLREIGVETGGSNVQFGINPKDGRMVIIEMNPRVSRSSRWLPGDHRFPHRQRSPPSSLSVTPWTS